MNAHDLWHGALGEIQGQMSKAPFDQWLRPTRARDLTDGVLTIEVSSAYAREWIEERLKTTVLRTVTGIYGNALDVKFVTREVSPADEKLADKPGDIVVDLIESPLVPYIQVQKYALWYWQPILGCIAFATWNMLRTLDKQNDGEGNRHRVSVEVVADTLAVHRQSITGRPRGSSWTDGAFDVLNREGLAKIEQIGKGRSAIWWARVLNSVPFLAPAQVGRLSDTIQERHDRFLKDFAVDTEKWEQITIESLVPGHKETEYPESLVPGHIALVPGHKELMPPTT